MDLATAYRDCARLTRREARNFYFAFLSLPRAQRHAVYALYAFCRSADDAVDSATPESETARPDDDWAAGAHESPLDKNAGGLREAGSTSARRGALERLRKRLERAANGDPEDGPDVALADAIERYGVDPSDLADVLDGMEMDLDLRRIEDFEALRTYCYRAASAVGLATLPILSDGVPPTDAMRDAAIDLGLGMQLVNILRDVAEDLERDRVYLPLDELSAAGVSESELSRAAAGRGATDALVRFLEEQADRATGYLERGRRLLPLLPRRGRRCPGLLGEIYGRILRRIRDGGFDISNRVGLPTREKVGLLVSSLWRSP